MSKLQPLICPECAGHIDRDSMTCKFCGIQFKLDEYDRPIFVTRFDPKMETLHASIMISDYEIEAIGEQRAAEYAVEKLAHKLAECIAPFMEIQKTTDARYCREIIDSRIRVIRPDHRFYGDWEL